jgi:hypothetical protein
MLSTRPVSARDYAGVIELQEGEKHLRKSVRQQNRTGQMQLGFGLLSRVFGRFDFTEA